MKKSVVIVTLWLLFACLVTGVTAQDGAAEADRTPDTFAQSLRAGCYIVAANQCRIHVEPFTIPVNTGSGERVAEFQIYASNFSGGASYTLYHAHTDSNFSYKPVGNYSPSLVTEDFYGQCGQTYSVGILTRGDTLTIPGNFGNAGVTGQFTCPESPAAPTAILQSFLQLDAQNNLVISWQWLLLALPLALFSLWWSRRDGSA